MEFDPIASWNNPAIDNELGIIRKFYPTWLRPYGRELATTRCWDMISCLCTDRKYYVIDRHIYNKMSRHTFEEHRIGPYRSEPEATLAAEMLSQLEGWNETPTD